MLPSDVVGVVAEHLNPEHMVCAAMTCHTWRLGVASNESLWVGPNAPFDCTFALNETTTMLLLSRLEVLGPDEFVLRIHERVTATMLKTFIPKFVEAGLKHVSAQLLGVDINFAAPDFVQFFAMCGADLESLNLRGAKIASTVENVPTLKLKQLNISQTSPSLDFLKVLASSCPELEKLEVVGRTTQEQFDTIADIASLKSLNVSQMDDPKVNKKLDLANIAKLKELEELNATWAPLSDAALQAIAKLPKLHTLNLRFAAGNLEHLAGASTLKTLELSMLQNLDQPGRFVNIGATLETLSLSKAEPAHIDVVAGSCPCLTAFSVWVLQKGGLERLAAMLHGLQTLELGYCVDASAKDFMAFAGNDCVKHLTLLTVRDNTGFTHDTVEALEVAATSLLELRTANCGFSLSTSQPVRAFRFKTTVPVRAQNLVGPRRDNIKKSLRWRGFLPAQADAMLQGASFFN